MNPIWGQSDPIEPVFWPWGPTRPDSTWSLGPKLGSTWKNGFDLATLVKILRDGWSFHKTVARLSNSMIERNKCSTLLSKRLLLWLAAIFCAPPMKVEIDQRLLDNIACLLLYCCCCFYNSRAVEIVEFLVMKIKLSRDQLGSVYVWLSPKILQSSI